jgi:hypothetical protein
MATSRPALSIPSEAVAGLCVRHHVRKLDLFGSAATAAFDPERSDVDFLVEFERLDPVDLADHYFGLKHDLEGLLGRRVDLVETRAIKNPLFREEAMNTRLELFAA